MSLPYEKSEAYSFGGKLYKNEKEVLTAAVEKLLGEGHASTAINVACELAPLLARVCELGNEQGQTRART